LTSVSRFVGSIRSARSNSAAALRGECDSSSFPSPVSATAELGSMRMTASHIARSDR
jgi:hypothetical protein